jgi:hypothetical protein
MRRSEPIPERAGNAPSVQGDNLSRWTLLKHRVIGALFADVVASATAEALASVTVRVDDCAGWHPLQPAGPHDREFSEWYQDQQDALEAWRKNFQVRRIVTLTRSYVLGGGITLASDHRYIQHFLNEFIDHPQNRLARRYSQICDELTRAGEIFPILFTNPADGMSYLRFVPASQITQIETDPEDYETELRYRQAPAGASDVEGNWWIGEANPEAWIPDSTGHLPPVMLHYAVNRPIGATRGEGDLTPILRWALRYANFLEDRCRLNRVRTRQNLLVVELADDSKVLERKRQYESQDPLQAGIVVTGPGEEHKALPLNIHADDAKEDARALRLAVATGANTALHYMGEGEATNYATAREMGEPTARFYTERQGQLCEILQELVIAAYKRKCALGLARPPAGEDYRLRAVATETARADNAGLAEAARNIVEAFRAMKAEGWIDDRTATTLAFKFAGEALAAAELEEILARAEEEKPAEEETPPAGQGDPQNT